MTTDPNSEFFEKPDYKSVKAYIVPKEIKLKKINIASLSAKDFNNFPRGNDLKQKILSKTRVKFFRRRKIERLLKNTN